MARRRKRSKNGRKGRTVTSKSGIRYRKSSKSRTGWVKVGGKKRRAPKRRKKARRSSRRRAPKRKRASARRRVRRNPFGGAWSMF